MSRSPIAMRCSDHDGKPFEFYCRSCESLGCSMCVLVTHRDHTNEVSDALEAIPDHLTRVKSLYEEASIHLETAQEVLDDTASTIGKLKENKDCAERRIRNYFQRMRNILIDREHHFINTVRRNAEGRKKSSSNVRKSVSDLMQGLVVCVKELWDLSTRTEGGDIMVLKEEKRLSDRLKEVVKLLKELQNCDEISYPNTTITLPCVEDHNFEKVCRLVGDPWFKTCSPNCSNDFACSPEHNASILAPPPIPPRPKSRTSTDPHSINLTRPARSKSTCENPVSTSPDLSVSVTPPPVPPRSPVMTNKSHIPQWILDYKEKLNKENEQMDDNNDQSINDENSKTYSILLKKTPTPKPRKVNANAKQQTGVSIYEKPTTAKTNGMSLADLKLNELKINIDPPTPKSEQVASFYEPRSDSDSRSNSRPSSRSDDSHSGSRSGSQSDDSPGTLQVYEILLKQNVKKAPVYPSGICVGPTNTLIVWDTRNSCIMMLTSTGKFLDYIFLEESSYTCFNELVHVCVDKSNNILVLDAGASPRIMKFSKTGKYISRLVPKRSLRSSPMVKPHGMAVSHHGNILVSDWSKSCIHVFDCSGKYIKNFGSSNASSDQFMMQPTGIAVDYNGRVIITDGMAHHIWIYTPDGELLNHFGWHGHNAGELHTPFGVTVDRNGLIYITEQGNNRVSVFKGSGEHIKCFGGRGVSIGEFNSPKHLCVDSENRLVVTDEGNHRLQVFNIN